jgi:hypothetical protein
MKIESNGRREYNKYYLMMIIGGIIGISVRLTKGKVSRLIPYKEIGSNPIFTRGL